MPMTPNHIFQKIGVHPSCVTRWGERVPVRGPGVYLVSRSRDGNASPRCQRCPFDHGVLADWIKRAPDMRLNEAVPTPAALDDYLSGFWHADEAIVYIGQATGLGARLEQFFRHRLGDRRPHAGGHWLKTLSHENLWIHAAACRSARDAIRLESLALDLFQAAVLSVRPELVATPARAIPFANRAHNGRKQTLLTKQTI